MKKRVIRAAYDDREPVNNPLSGEPTRVKQEFKKDVDINTIIDRVKKGQNPPAWMTENTPRYGDFSNLPASFQEAHAIMAAGQAAFASLPLEMRRELDHDPRNLDRAPKELFERFGLLKQKNSAGASPEPVKAHGSSPKAEDDESRDRPSKGASAPKNAPKKGAQDADE